MPPLIRAPRASLFLLYWYFMEVFMSFMAWWWFYSREKALLGDSLVVGHFVCNVIGSVLYVGIGSVLMFWPYRYYHQMLASSRRNRIMAGVYTIFLSRDLPCWLMEFWVVWKHGWIHVLQGVSVLLTTVSFGLGLVMCWLIYTWKLAKYLEHQFGSSETNAVLATAVHGQAGTLEEPPKGILTRRH
eukprot:TRINITY_DN54608_c0_g1_i1.p1 TRINITY_DN54608_c0_g1~~TRINITY_DN54608_c0_g1_i1.p1  ORF type:complete len:186 (+),score=55.21 TRINITY_DN54608_c0_g1_i1:193-750(+)